VGKFAVAPKFDVQTYADWEYEWPLPQAVIVPGDVASMKFVGKDWNVTDSSSGGAVVEDEVCVAVWYIVCVTNVWVSDWVVVLDGTSVCIVD